MCLCSSNVFLLVSLSKSHKNHKNIITILIYVCICTGFPVANYYSIFVYMHASISLCLWGGCDVVFVCGHWGVFLKVKVTISGTNPKVLSTFLLVILKQDTLNTWFQQGSQAGNAGSCSFHLLLLPSSGSLAQAIIPSVIRVLRLKRGPEACKVSTLWTDPFPQPRQLFLN